MTEKCYKVQFTAHLHRLTLALKMNCEIEIIWKRGEKVCESGKYTLGSGVAEFDKKISICCNMLYDTKAKIFKQKITKFAVILSSDRGTKQAGQILFDVAQYINERELNKKDYQRKLQKCPDKHAKLLFTLTGVLMEEISTDAISQSSYSEALLQSKASHSNPVMEGITNSMIIPNKQQKKLNEAVKDTNKKNNVGENEQKLQKVEQQNKRLKQQSKKIQKLKKQNQQLRKKIKNEDFNKVNQIKEKMEKLKREIQKMKAQVKSNKHINNQTKEIEDEILNCKIKIMKALNFCAEYGGGSLLDDVQSYCGMHQKQ